MYESDGERMSGMGTGMVNPLHYEATDPDVLWSPGNVAEAIPGVSSALNWSFVGDAIEVAARRAFHAIGVLRRDELAVPPRVEERFMACFYGRTVANIDAMRVIGDRTPGTSANAVEEQLFGVVRPGAENHPDASRVPFVAARMPRAVARLARDNVRHRRAVESAWRAAVLAPPTDLAAARALMAEARTLYARSFELGTLASMLAQGLYDRVVALAEQAGRPGLEHRLVTGYAGMLETGLVVDLWALAHGEMDRASFLLRHGYHGPNEGQLDSSVWREDPRPLDALVRRYAELGDDAHPARAEGRQVAAREAAEAELLRAAGRLRAPGARAVLALARTIIPQREIGKANYTQSLDIARIAARAAGHALAQRGALDLADDIFGLTYDEVLAAGPADLRALAAERRAIRADYLTTDLAEMWTGPARRAPLATGDEDEPAGDGDDDAPVSVVGEPVGGGAVTARVRVVVDPVEDDLEPGEILVCRMTDPGWASLFALAGGIAVDMGGQMSHGAIVARELGLPCVTCTVDGTRRLRTGDLVRLDGDTGRIDILDRQETTV